MPTTAMMPASLMRARMITTTTVGMGTAGTTR
jgi:hypothetical protein